MTDLADFLLARIAEDEAAARQIQDGPVWVADGGSVYFEHPSNYVVDYTNAADHIARWDPARVLAECEAKRRIIEAEPERWVRQPDAPGSTVDMGCPDGMVRVYGKLITELEYRDRYMELAPPPQVLLFLAIPYSDHPEFREEWRA